MQDITNNKNTNILRDNKEQEVVESSSPEWVWLIEEYIYKQALFMFKKI